MASSTERIGVYHCAEIAERNNWMFREQPIDDVGIDAHMELVESTGNGNATGGTTGENSGGESKPQTSDNANIALYAVMAIVSLAGLLVIGKKKFFK